MPAIDHAPMQLQAAAGQPMHIQLEAMPGAGVMWSLSAAPPGCRLQSLDSLPAGAGVGSAALQRFELVCSQPGRHSLRFELKRPWETAVRAVQQVEVTVTP